MKHQALKTLVEGVLRNWQHYDWSLQGFGMLRCYLDDDHATRLHVWSPEMAVPNVSTLHTHPWDFTSTIVAGQVRNRLLVHGKGERMVSQAIRCGEGGCAVGRPVEVDLRVADDRIYLEGETYSQRADEIHESLPADGAVSIIERTFGDDTEHAYVYWPLGQSWVSAEPRKALSAEVNIMTKNALDRWF